jgi:hypothetical protein
MFKIEEEETDFLHDYNLERLWEGRATYIAPFNLVPKSPSFEADHFIKLGFNDQVRGVKSLKIMSSIAKCCIHLRVTNFKVYSSFYVNGIVPSKLCRKQVLNLYFSKSNDWHGR